MAYQKYSSTKQTALTTALSASDVTVTVVDGSTYPDPALPGNGPYTLLLGYGSDREEIVTVTEKPTVNTFTVIRGEDGSSATSKNIGDIVVHGATKRDWEDLMPRSGGAFTGFVTLHADAEQDPHPTTKRQLDAAVATLEGSLDTAIAGAVPIGAIVAYGGSVAPAGWHLCDGTAHGSAALQAVLGSAVTPNLRDRFIVGAGLSYARGATGGAATVTLTAAQSGVPAHNHGAYSGTESADHYHSVDPPSTTSGGQSANHTHTGSTGGMTSARYHNHTIGSGAYQYALTFANTTGAKGSGGYAYIEGWSNVNDSVDLEHGHSFVSNGASVGHTHNVDIPAFNSGYRSAAHSHAVTVNNNAAANASSSHENRPPYWALTYIIKKA